MPGRRYGDAGDPAVTEPLAGYRPAKPMVFAGLYPVESNAYGDLREALERLKLNDAALSYEPETSAALGFGFRCGFLGLLHMEIVHERLEREYQPRPADHRAERRVPGARTDGEVVIVDNPSEMPDTGVIASIEEPVMQINILAADALNRRDYGSGHQ